VTLWGCPYAKFGEDVTRAQAALVTSLSGMVQGPGVYALAVGTPFTVAAIAHLIGWVTIVEIPEA
jgi:hypothetical protein